MKGKKLWPKRKAASSPAFLCEWYKPICNLEMFAAADAVRVYGLSPSILYFAYSHQMLIIIHCSMYAFVFKFYFISSYYSRAIDACCKWIKWKDEKFILFLRVTKKRRKRIFLKGKFWI